ncbi:response regulator transcription factor [Roseomonas haemaphysalidis]|uniref:Response regulator transcription factor n=1 Tax=Roseomonas haemaphysalidis TaxID=2768162 RepID=A0ABS3KLD3_9PROT|nr:response regulator transcription factor [Roseomonas haemaphysalidis]MBO1077765.1 response regulator transcription factor [Roseomonas haemaphysalidis]
MRVLIIEDDAATADYLAKGLQEVGHVVEVARTGRDGLFLALNESFDALITDRMLPGPDGISILRALRTSGDRTPVLVITARGELEARVEGLDAGADDYLVKPFAFSELRARLDAMTRRAAQADTGEAAVLRVADLEMNLLRRTVRRGGAAIELLPTEFRLLEYMMRHPGEVLTRTMLLERVWDFNFDPTTNVVDVHVSRLRRKLDTGGPPLIRTLRGAGYVLGGGAA